MNWHELLVHLVDDHDEDQDGIEALDSDTCRYVHSAIHASGGADHEHASHAS